MILDKGPFRLTSLSITFAIYLEYDPQYPVSVSYATAQSLTLLFRPSMESSFSLEMERLLSPVSLPIARLLSLSYLPAHFPTILLAFVGFQLLEWFSPMFLAHTNPTYFGRADSRTRHNMWANLEFPVSRLIFTVKRVVRVVSMAHALMIIPLALFFLDIPELDKDRAFGYDVRVGHIHAIACGYEWSRRWRLVLNLIFLFRGYDVAVS